LFGNSPLKLDKTRGTFIAFPSFMLHRVTPVTRGTRWSLVAWILGTRWR
jgi:PKHD-type hydroxylase